MITPSRLFALIAIAALALITSGCVKEEPVAPPTPQSAGPVTGDVAASQPKIITLEDILGVPAGALQAGGYMTDATGTVSATVTGTVYPTKSKTLSLSKKFINPYTQKYVYLTWKLAFPSGAVAQALPVSMTANWDLFNSDISSSFLPSPTTNFLKPAILNVTAYPVDTTKLHPGVYHLYYVDDQTGLYVLQQAQSVTVSTTGCKLVCVNGVIPHFSRYCFGY